MNETNLEVMATFSHPLRVQLMQLLSQRKMTVQELADELPISAGGVRPHIGYFADRKLLHTERQGRSVRYWLNRERLTEALSEFGSAAGIDVRMIRSWKVEDPDDEASSSTKRPKKTKKTTKSSKAKSRSKSASSTRRAAPKTRKGAGASKRPASRRAAKTRRAATKKNRK